MIKVSGIYVIINTITHDVYVGQAVNLIGRWKVHFRKLVKGKHPNKKLQNDFSKYGRGAFEFHRVEICAVEFLCEKEGHYIKVLGATYNQASAPKSIRRDGSRFNSLLQALRKWKRRTLQQKVKPQ
jgi:group I intron endonuclease